MIKAYSRGQGKQWHFHPIFNNIIYMQTFLTKELRPPIKTCSGVNVGVPGAAS